MMTKCIKLQSKSYLDEANLPDPLGVLLQESVESSHAGHETLGVVQSVNSQNHLCGHLQYG